MRVVLVDDSQDIRSALRRLLEAEPGMEVVGCAEDVAGAVDLIERERPDLVVLDVNLRGGERGLDVLAHLQRVRPGLTVVVLSNCAEPSMRRAVLDAGAQACFDKAFEFREAVRWIVDTAARIQTSSSMR